MSVQACSFGDCGIGSWPRGAGTNSIRLTMMKKNHGAGHVSVFFFNSSTHGLHTAKRFHANFQPAKLSKAFTKQGVYTAKRVCSLHSKAFALPSIYTGKLLQESVYTPKLSRMCRAKQAFSLQLLQDAFQRIVVFSFPVPDASKRRVWRETPAKFHARCFQNGCF